MERKESTFLFITTPSLPPPPQKKKKKKKKIMRPPGLIPFWNPEMCLTSGNTIAGGKVFIHS